MVTPYFHGSSPLSKHCLPRPLNKAEIEPGVLLKILSFGAALRDGSVLVEVGPREETLKNQRSLNRDRRGAGFQGSACKKKTPLRRTPPSGVTTAIVFKRAFGAT